MRQALQLAERARGRTSPNPMVGAVLVRGGRVVGEGFHRRAGAAHAEIVALHQAGAQSRGATLYVTLEPCDHIGRTPPCCDAIIDARVRRVVIGATDPNPLTRGRGVRHLRRAGITVTRGVLTTEARQLNRVFETYISKKRPFITLKLAQSLDGKIACVTGDSRWISSPASRREVHVLRSQVDAVLVGVGTVLSDDPKLTARQRGGLGQLYRRQPWRVIVDSRLRTPRTAQLLRGSKGGRVIIATTLQRTHARAKALAKQGAEIWSLASAHGRVSLTALCRRLAQDEISHVLIEGGSELAASALRDGLVDHVKIAIAPLLLGGTKAPTSVGGSGVRKVMQGLKLKRVTVKRVGPDVVVEGDITGRLPVA